MSRRILVPIANGSEEIEAVTIIDVLRRAGARVDVASVETTTEVVASRGVRLVADCLIERCRDRSYDLIVLPGGMPGAERLRDSAPLTAMLRRQRDTGGWYGAICAAPAVVLQQHDLLGGVCATVHPAFSDQLENQSAIHSRVVTSGRCVTSRGPGTALEFAIELVKLLYGEQQAKEVAGPMLMNSPTG